MSSFPVSNASLTAHPGSLPCSQSWKRHNVVNSSTSLADGALSYGSWDNDQGDIILDLNSFKPSDFDLSSSTHLVETEIPRQETFSYEIAFSREMDTTIPLNNAIRLISADGNILPVHTS